MAIIDRIKWPVLAGLLVGVIAMFMTVKLASATPPLQENTPEVPLQAKACSSCHEEITQSWASSPHAHAFDDPNYQERWHALNDTRDCLLCHTTNYQATTGSYDAPGVSCEACHGKIDKQHPMTPAEVKDDAAYCGTCHTTTLGEWRLTGHATAEVSCTDCHDSHSQKALFENPDDMCVNCHKDSMGPYLENIHSEKGIGCVDCHALVIPPAEPPQDGIVPTGHTFTITPATCVACHTDALHSGFSLPGYENGAKTANAEPVPAEANNEEQASQKTVHTPEEQIQKLENQLQTVQASAASSSMTVVFQGGVVGLVLGGSTAWIVANNIRRGRKQEDEASDDEEEE
jgi:predicted CXXCH cytochrome family protein